MNVSVLDRCPSTLKQTYAKVDGSSGQTGERWLDIKLFNAKGHFVLFFFYIYVREYKLHMNSGRRIVVSPAMVVLQHD